MQSIRQILKVALSLVGMLVAFFGVVYFQEDIQRLLAVLVGMLLVEAAVWNLANPLLPKNRRYLELRAEVEGFIGHVPALNSVALDARSSDAPADWERYRSVLEEMHASVERMGAVAGKKEGEPITQPPSL